MFHNIPNAVLINILFFIVIQLLHLKATEQTGEVSKQPRGKVGCFETAKPFLNLGKVSKRPWPFQNGQRF